MTMTLDEVPGVPRKKRSHKKRRSRKARRLTKIIAWSVVGIIMAALYIGGAIYMLVSSTGVLGR